MREFHHRRLPDGAPRTRGTVMITDDGKEYVYAIDMSELTDFKAWATATFAGGMNCKRLAGRYPFYDVRQPS